MPSESNNPPDPLLDELYSLTKMTSAEEIRDASLKVTKVIVMKGLHRKLYRGSKIKVSTPGSMSVGAGSLLKRLQSSKVTGKAHDRNETSPIDNRGGKRAENSHVDNLINKVLFDLESSSLDSHLKFSFGLSVENKEGCALSKAYKPNDFVNGNDGSFICASRDKSPHLDDQCKLVAKSSSLMTGVDPTCMGDVGSMSCDQTSSKDGIAIAEIGSGIDVDMAGPNDRGKLASMEDVVGTGLVSFIPMDGIASDKGGDKFEFGKISSLKGIFNKPNKAMFTLNSGPNVKMSNPFIEKPVGTSSWNAWGSNKGTPFGPTILSNQYSADAERFAEKLKKRSEEVALKMEYVPSAVSKMENGNRRIMFSVEEVIKGGQACTLQLYGYFVDTSMDYHPMLMDRMTKERCLKKARKLDFARVLVEVSANEELPNVLEIAYPPIGNREAKVGKLEAGINGNLLYALTAKLLVILFWLEYYNAMKSDEEGFTQVSKNNKSSNRGNVKGGLSKSGQSSGIGNSQNSNRGNVGSKGKSNQTGSSYVKKNVGPSPGISDMSKDNRSLTNSLDIRNHLKIHTTFLSGQPGRPYLCINKCG
nr:hypothetical protein [Tanacetum cinerariifolium]